MNYNYLRYFSVLAQLEHYTLAAARLGISQPSFPPVSLTWPQQYWHQCLRLQSVCTHAVP